MTQHDRVSSFQDRIEYRFKDSELLERALTHASTGDGRRQVRDNQRLEFVGDRVLGLLAAERLFADFDDDEGGLAPRLNAIVRKEACARAAERAGIGAALRMSKSTEDADGRESTSILGDACEAVLAALYLDGGFEAARAFFDRFWAEELPGVLRRPVDAKTALQEWSLKHHGVNPTYETIERTGPDHRPVFGVEARIKGLKPERGEGKSKQNAELAAAKAMLKREGVDD